MNRSSMIFELDNASEGPDQPPGLEDHHLREETAKEEEPTAVQIPLQRQPTTAGHRTQSRRQVRVPKHLIVMMTAMVPSDKKITSDVNTIMDDMHRHDYEIQEEMRNPITFLSTVNKERETMYYHEAVKQKNSKIIF